MKKIVLSITLLLASLISSAQLITPFTSRFSVTQKGGIVMIANTASGCGTGTTACGSKSCAQAHAEVAPLGTSVDNDFVNTYVDIDNDASTFMSSSDSLSLPSCSQISFAGLYWGAGGTTSDPNGSHWSTRGTVKLKLNNGTYQTLTADATSDNTTGYKSYHNFKNITSIVAAAGVKGRYTIADMPMLNDNGTTKNRWGGWAIVIVYKNDLLPLKNLTVFNGLTNVSSGNPSTDLSLSGFFTPPTGPVSLELGLLTYDGDRGKEALGGSCAQTYVGDSLLFRSAGGFIPVSDAIHPANDVFNSTISNNGVLNPYRNPSYNNTLGHDANIFVPNNALKNYIGNSATTATLRQKTGGETYLTQVVTTAIDVYDVDLRGGLSVVDLNGGGVQPGDTLEYTLSIKNIGSDQSINTYITDTIATNSVYVPGSIRITGGPNQGNKTDVISDDQAEYFSASHSLKVRIGTGANATTGGFVNNSPIAIDSTQIKFKVTATTNCTILLCNNVIQNRFWVYGTGVLSNLTRVAGSNPIIFDSNGCPIPGTTKTLVSAATCGGPSASNNSPVCQRGTINLSVATVSGATYAWAGPNGFTSTLQNPTISNATVAMSGTYTVTINSGSNCTYATSTVVTVNPAPSVSISANSPICIGNNLNLTTPAIAGVTYSWSGPNSFASSIQNPSIANVTLAMAGTYSLTETYTATGCTSTAATTTVVVNNFVQTVPTVNPVSPLCVGNTIHLTTPTVSGVTYQWTGPNNFSSSSQNPNISNATTAMAGTYSLTLTNASPGCTSAAGTTTVVVNALPNVGASSSSSSVCSGSSVTLTGSGASSYSWTGGVSNGVSFVPASSGSYTVTGIDGNGCSNTSSISITLNSNPIGNSVVSSPIACNGGTATVAVSATGGTAPYTGTGNNTVNAGSYTYTVSDANGCSSTTTVTVSEPTAIVASSTAGTILCNGGTTTVVVSATGGTSPYTGTGSFTVSAGNYSYTVTDANGCTSATSVTTGNVTEPTAVSISANAGTIACNGGTTTITVTGNGGTAPYTGTGTFTVSAGTYTYTVTDANGCSPQSATTTVTVSEPTAIVASSTAGTILCNGGTTTVVVSATGGTAPYTGTGSFTVSAGNYSYTVTDANGCTSATSVTTENVTEPTAVSISANAGTIACNGGTTTITVTGNGGTAPYTGTGTFTVSAGTYTYTVTDANGCSPQSATTTVTVSEPTAIVASSTAGTILCNGGTTTVNVTATGGTAPYTGTGSFTVSAGNYSYTVTDANGCTSATSVTTENVTEPTAVSISANAGTIACNGGTTTITVTGNGGTAPYTGTGTFTVSAGTYTYTVTDANGCSPQSATTTVTVSEPTAIVASSTAGTILCNGGTTTVNVTATGGTAPYTGTGSFTVSAGNYSYTVTDANGCTSATSVTTGNVTEPTAVSISANAGTIACNGGTTTITVTGNGGTAPYTGTGTFTVSAGTYTYTVTDANGCSPQSATTTVTVSEPTAIVASSTAGTILCNGGTTTVNVTATGGTAPYTGTGSFTVSAGNYSYTVTDANGCTSATSVTTENVTEPTAVSISANAGTIACNGGTTTITVTGNGGTAPYTGTGTFTVSAGTYTYTVTDANGCSPQSATTTVTVSEPTAIVASSTAGTILCNGGTTTVNVTATGGTAPYTGTGSFTVSAGNYSYTVTDANGCTSATSVTTENVTEPTAVSISANAGTIACNGGTTTITVTGNGGTAPYTGTGTFTVSAGTYTYTVTDANGCSPQSATTTVTVSEPTVLSASSTAGTIACNGGTTSVVVSATGGTAPYTGTGSFTVSAGNYSYTVTDANGCSSVTSGNVSQPVPLTVNAVSNQTLCNNANTTVVSFTGTVSGTVFDWTNSNPSIGLASTGSGNIASFVATNNGSTAVTATITVTPTLNGCSGASISFTITVNPSPNTPVVANNTPACVGSTISLSTPQVIGAPYNWTGPNSFSSNVQNPVISTSATTAMSGTYSLTVTNPNTGCSSTGTTVVTVNAIPATPTANSNSPICMGSSIDFSTASVAGAIYTWTGPGFAPSSTFQNPSIASSTLNMTGTYTLTVTTNGCTSAPASVQVTVNDCNPHVTIVKTVNNVHPIIGHDVVFTIVVSNSGPGTAYSLIVTDNLPSGYTYVSSNTSNGNAYNSTNGQWLIDSLHGGASETLTITATVNHSGNYVNIATVIGTGIDVLAAIAETHPEVLNIPEGFSPNGDGTNDVFVIRGLENYPDNTFVIFNRWGNKVYEASPYLNNWSGNSTTGVRVGGDELPIGTYFYVLDLGDGSDVYKGTIYLNR